MKKTMKNEQMNQNRTTKHGAVYCCKRTKLMAFLRMKGFIPFKVLPELYNPKYLNYYYYNSPELEDVITEYFSQFKKTN